MKPWACGVHTAYAANCYYKTNFGDESWMLKLMWKHVHERMTPRNKITQSCTLHYGGEKDTVLSSGCRALLQPGRQGFCFNKPSFHRRLLYLANLLLCSAAILEDEDGGKKEQREANRRVLKQERVLTKEERKKKRKILQQGFGGGGFD